MTSDLGMVFMIICNSFPKSVLKRNFRLDWINKQKQLTRLIRLRHIIHDAHLFSAETDNLLCDIIHGERLWISNNNGSLCTSLTSTREHRRNIVDENKLHLSLPASPHIKHF